jgi:hypothetical protein
MTDCHGDENGFSASDWAEISILLAGVGRSVRDAIRNGEASLAPQQVVGFFGGDTIFQIDEVAEDKLRDAFGCWQDRYKPIQL